MGRRFAAPATTKNMGGAMQIDEKLYRRMPPDLRALFDKMPNPQREEVLAAFPDAAAGGNIQSSAPSDKTGTIFGKFTGRFDNTSYQDAGSAARFFYSAKADAGDRLGSKHPTVKPVDLMAYLCRLVTPPGGTVLDPFAGSGTTGMACLREGFDCILIEREREYYEDIIKRLDHVRGADTPLFSAAASSEPQPEMALPLYGIGGTATPGSKDG